MKKESKPQSKPLTEIIKRMREIQADIAADSQPLSLHELDELEKLGQEYAVIVARLKNEVEKSKALEAV